MTEREKRALTELLEGQSEDGFRFVAATIAAYAAGKAAGSKQSTPAT